MDFYYQALVIYLIFFAVYVLFKGTIGESFIELYNDPIFYILIFFIIIFLGIVIANLIRSPKIIIKDNKVVFENKFGKREVLFSDILNIKIGRTRLKGEEITYKIIKLKLRNRRKLLKIRANDFERGEELINEFLNLKKSE